MSAAQRFQRDAISAQQLQMELENARHRQVRNILHGPTTQHVKSSSGN